MKILSKIKTNLINSIYFNTKGLNEKIQLTLNFMKRKMREYDELKSE